MARITLEDLDRLGDEEEEEDEEGGEDEEDEEERGRLFAHWEAVASTHRVNLPRGERRGEPGRGAARTGGGGRLHSPARRPRAVLCLADMAGPIVQMSRHSQAREAVPYVALSQHGKVRPRRARRSPHRFSAAAEPPPPRCRSTELPGRAAAPGSARTGGCTHCAAGGRGEGRARSAPCGFGSSAACALGATV